MTFTGVNQFNNNGIDGLNVTSYGAITVSNMTATGNGSDGAYLYNWDAGTVQPVTLSGTNNLSNNYNTGLFVKSKGAITISGLTANSNTHGYGAQLSNNFTPFAQVITINGGTFNHNLLSGLVNGLLTNGLDIQSNVAVKLNSVPMWCPAGILPGGVGCSKSYANLQALVADVGSGFHPTANGVIWIQNTTFEPGGAIVFDGSTSTYWTAWSNFSLTFQGGWSGPGATISSTTPTTIQDPFEHPQLECGCDPQRYPLHGCDGLDQHGPEGGYQQKDQPGACQGGHQRWERRPIG